MALDVKKIGTEKNVWYNSICSRISIYSCKCTCSLSIY